tara:strand:- start:1 stop:165 length:165 start_codon:yes stop_codon:yes gene_type:complete
MHMHETVDRRTPTVENGRRMYNDTITQEEGSNISDVTEEGKIAKPDSEFFQCFY